MSILIFKWILVKHLDVLIAFVNCGLKVEHVKKIANMIAPDKDYMVNIYDGNVCSIIVTYRYYEAPLKNHSSASVNIIHVYAKFH